MDQVKTVVEVVQAVVSIAAVFVGRKADDLAGRAVRLAAKVLKREAGYLEDLRAHDFRDDQSAHDDESVERLYAEFAGQVRRVQAALTAEYGPPARAGTDGDRAVGLNGVFRFAVWRVGGRRLYVAAHHEDRGCPSSCGSARSPRMPDRGHGRRTRRCMGPPPGRALA